MLRWNIFLENCKVLKLILLKRENLNRLGIIVEIEEVVKEFLFFLNIIFIGEIY